MIDKANAKHREIRDALDDARQKRWNISIEEDQLGLPRTTSGKIKIPQDWLPELKKEMRRFCLSELFQHALIELDGGEDWEQWHGAWMFGQGGHSTAGRWVKADGDGNFIDRVVRKDTYRDAGVWSDMSLWDNTTTGLRNHPDLIIPNEVKCHQLMSTIKSTRLGESVNVPGLRHWELDLHHLNYVMYLEYCEWGNLNDLIHGYRQRVGPDAPYIIPEPFVWRVFLALAVTGLAMEKGTIDEGEKNDDWTKEIVHRDLKPQNIFLDIPTIDHFESYPSVAVGDFGISIRTGETDLLNPTMFLRFRGTPGFAAPEQYTFTDLRNCKPVHRFKQLAHTNVYGTGMVLFALMALKHDPEEKIWLGDGIRVEFNLDAPACAEKTSRYSRQLVEMVNSCIQFDPSKRPSFEKLIEDIEVEFIGALCTNGRKNPEDMTGTWRDEDDLHIAADLYSVGLAMADLPPRPRTRDVGWYVE